METYSCQPKKKYKKAETNYCTLVVFTSSVVHLFNEMLPRFTFARLAAMMVSRSPRTVYIYKRVDDDDESIQCLYVWFIRCGVSKQKGQIRGFFFLFFLPVKFFISFLF